MTKSLRISLILAAGLQAACGYLVFQVAPFCAACEGPVPWGLQPRVLQTFWLASTLILLGIWGLIGIFRARRWFNFSVLIAALGAFLAASGAALSLWLDLSPWAAALCQVFALAASVMALWVALKRPLHFANTPACWTFAMVALSWVVQAFIARAAPPPSCWSWPLCYGNIAPLTGSGALLLGGRVLQWVAALLALAALRRAWQTQRAQTVSLSAAVLLVIGVYSPLLIGGLHSDPKPDEFMSYFQALTASSVWIAVMMVVLFPERSEDPLPPVDARQRARDLLTLTRPIVVLLLLVTAYGGMVVGAKAWPPLTLVFWTLLGGALSAGGAQAINQYVDRDIDLLMGRTARRPIPAGRMTPAEGLAWGLGLCAVAVIVVASAVDGLAALLVLAGILYYVVLYTLILKRTSAQNIVIGGGAGAMAPVVGYAAVTGRLDLAAIFLFLIIFLWTPPHFWALAIVRLKDYARAGVPMLPVVLGEEETRRQIAIYTLVLAIVTILMPLLGQAGLIYLGAAVMLNLWLFYTVWKVWKYGGNKITWGLYRVSSMYLAFLFVALMIDAVL